MTPADLGLRFWSKVEQRGSCLSWVASSNGKGYGQYWHEGKMRLAHRIAYEAVRGAIPDGLHLDHLCRHRPCVNPDHLEAVTPAENIRRGQTGINNSRKTHCPAGHEYTAENTFVGSDNRRKCRPCHRSRDRKRKALRRTTKHSTQPLALDG